MKVIGWLLLIGLSAVLLYIALLAVSALLVNGHKEYDKNSRYYRWLLNSATAVGMWLLRVRIHVSGLENIPKGTRFLLVGNHRSNFDPLVTWLVLRKYDIAYISKEENFHIPVFGRLIRKCAFMAIDREDPRKAIKTIYHAADLIHKDEVSVGVYPEGTRSKECVLLPFHNGVFKIAQKADVPIVVVAIRGTEKIHKQFVRRVTDVYVDVIDCIPAEEVHVKPSVIGERVYQDLSLFLAQHPDAGSEGARPKKEEGHAFA